MSRPLSFKDTQRGSVRLRTDLASLAAYLRRHEHWIPVGFRPLKVETLGSSYRLQLLPRLGALGFELVPQMTLRPIEEHEARWRLVSEAQPGLGYDIDFAGLFTLAPASEEVEVFWEASFAIRFEPPGWFGMLPQQAVQAAAQGAVSTMTASLSRSLVDNIVRDYPARTR